MLQKNSTTRPLLLTKEGKTAFQFSSEISVRRGDVQRFTACFSSEPLVQVVWRGGHVAALTRDGHCISPRPSLGHVHRLTEKAGYLFPAFQRCWCRRSFGFIRLLRGFLLT